MSNSSESLSNPGQCTAKENKGDVMSAPIINLTKCVLYAPSPNGPPPTTRDKPPGCKTVFVGGLPENATDDIMREIFQMSGEISTIRMSLKNFCHIRFTNEADIDRAINFSGYRIKIDNKDDAPNTGRLHVDFAQARDDQFEYDCRQRTVQREARHRSDDETARPPSPPPIAHYSDHEAASLGVKLRADDSFQTAAQVLITWLERGECNKKNAGCFYSMIQSTNSHIHRLNIEKTKYVNQMDKAKITLQEQMKSILIQLTEISKVFNAASLQKVWDHMSKVQRKNISTWKKELEEIKTTQVCEMSGERVDDEMELSDDEDNSSLDKSNDDGDGNHRTASTEEFEKLKEENESLKCKLDVSQNEVAVARTDLQTERSEKDEQIKELYQNMQSAFQDLFAFPIKKSKDTAELAEPLAKKRKVDDVCAEPSQELLPTKFSFMPNDCNFEILSDLNNCNNAVTSSSENSLTVTEAEVRLMGLISTFLNAHPFGASIDYICSYLNKIDCSFNARDVEDLMKKIPTLFKEESTGLGASLVKKWTFCGFKP